jgi:membrane protein implicated in regulation of membrane protease activity
MSELISLKIKAAISITSIIFSWIIAQASLVDTGFDQLFSIGLLLIAVMVIWKAFSRKDESETQLLREQIDILNGYIDVLRDDLQREREINDQIQQKN